MPWIAEESGNGTAILRSNRPWRSTAGSIRLGSLQAPTTITLPRGQSNYPGQECVDYLEAIAAAMPIAILARTDGVDLVDEEHRGCLPARFGKGLTHRPQHVAQMTGRLPFGE